MHWTNNKTDLQFLLYVSLVVAISVFVWWQFNCLSSNSLLVSLQFLVCCHLLFLSFVAILALWSIILMMLQFFFVLSHVTAISWVLICLAQNACLLLGLLQISAPVLLGSHSCLFLMPPYKNALITLKFSLVHCKSILLQTNSNWGLPFLSVFYAPCKCSLVFFFCTATAECYKQIPTWVVTIINVHDDNK